MRVWRERAAVWVVLAGAMLWGAFLSVPYLQGQDTVMDGLEYRLVDLRHKLAGGRVAAPDVRLVALDDETLASPLVRDLSRREILARLIRNINASGARVLVLDVLLTDAGTAEEDTDLADALTGTPAVIAAAISFDGADGTEPVPIWPQEVFAAAAQVGVVNLSTDGAGTPRHAPMLFPLGDATVASLPLLSAALARSAAVTVDDGSVSLNGHRVPLDAGLAMPLRYLGPEGTIPTVSAWRLLEGPLPDRLSGAIVVLGFSASATGDRFVTPFDDAMPGMEVIATAISQLVGGETLWRDAQTRRIDVGHAAALVLFSLGALLAFPLTRGIAIVLALFGLSFVVVAVCFQAGLWYSAALPIFAATPPAALLGALRYAEERKQAGKIARTAASLRRFQSPALARRIEEDPNYLLTPREQRLVVIFVDLTGFTGLSQRLGPEGTRALLQTFHRLCARHIEGRAGSIFNYMGDGVMAVFGMEDQATARYDALAATFEIVQALGETPLEGAPGQVLACRAGLHQGVVTLSRLGGEQHQQVTVSGDTVNFASRLMEVAKQEGAVVAASIAVCDDVRAHDLIAPARQTDVGIRGREGRESVFLWSREALLSLHPLKRGTVQG